MSTLTLPATSRALVVRDVNIDPQVETISTPQCLHGTAVIEVLAAPVISYAKEIFLGNSRKYTFPLPIVPGTSCIGRVAAVAPDITNTSLSPGALVYFDCLIRLRSEERTNTTKILSAIHDGFSRASKDLMANGGCRNGSHAEFMRVPAENIFALNEARLLGSPDRDRQTTTTSSSDVNGLGYTINDLGQIGRFLVPYGGFRSINLSAGETILIGPATGSFGAVAATLALAMGAKVIAWGRSASKLSVLQTKLSNLSHGRYKDLITTVVLTNDPEVDLQSIRQATNSKPLDACYDISPPAATGSTYIKTAILSLRHGGRASLMGGIGSDISIPHGFVMHNDITIKGKWMYDRDDIPALLRLVEHGILALVGRSDKTGVDGDDDNEKGIGSIVGSFGLNDWKKAWDLAYEKDGPGEMVVINPNK